MKLFDDIVSKMNIGKKYHMIIQYTDCKSQRLIFYDKISTLETFQNHLGLNWLQRLSHNFTKKGNLKETFSNEECTFMLIVPIFVLPFENVWKCCKKD